MTGRPAKTTLRLLVTQYLSLGFLLCCVCDGGIICSDFYSGLMWCICKLWIVRWKYLYSLNGKIGPFFVPLVKLVERLINVYVGFTDLL